MMMRHSDALWCGRGLLRRMLHKSKGLAIASALLVLPTQASDAANDYWPASLDAPWQTYMQQSAKATQALEQALATELATAKRTEAIPATKAKNFGLESIQNRQQLDAVLSYQTVLGGWSKRTDMRTVRQLAQLAGSEAAYIPTFDNGATSSQIRWLAAYYPSATPQEQAQIATALQLGVRYLLSAQYPNGGFPQSYPLRGGYHDAVTLNDQVLTELLRLMWDIGHAPQYQWLDSSLRQQARHGFERGMQWLVKAQVHIDGKRTVWAAQHHPLDATPVAARKFEQVSLVSTESAAVLQLMLDHATEQPGVIPALCAGARWLEQHAVRDKTWQRSATGSRLVEKAGAMTWARFYSLEQQQPVFFDRDGKTYTRVEQLSLERQRGYGWYQTDAKGFLKAWSKRPDLQQQCAVPTAPESQPDAMSAKH